VVESDCADVIEAMLTAGIHFGQDVAIIAECHQLASQFAKITFQHCPREGNEVADLLAKKAFQFVELSGLG
jgi:ribonuclease HI